MIYMKSGAQTSVRLTTNTQIYEINPLLHIRSIGDILYSKGSGTMTGPAFVRFSNTLNCNVIHDRSQTIYAYNPIIDVKVYKQQDTSLMYEYVIVYVYTGNLSNLDNTYIKLKLAITSY